MPATGQPKGLFHCCFEYAGLASSACLRFPWRYLFAGQREQLAGRQEGGRTGGKRASDAAAGPGPGAGGASKSARVPARRRRSGRDCRRTCGWAEGSEPQPRDHGRKEALALVGLAAALGSCPAGGDGGNVGLREGARLQSCGGEGFERARAMRNRSSTCWAALSGTRLGTRWLVACSSSAAPTTSCFVAMLQVPRPGKVHPRPGGVCAASGNPREAAGRVARWRRCGDKLSSVVISDLHWVTARPIMDHLIAGGSNAAPSPGPSSGRGACPLRDC